MSIYENIGLKKVVNASGKMTVLGASTLNEQVAQAMKEASMNFVVIDDLMNKAGEIISQHTGGEDACVTLGASAGIAISVAACIAGDKISKIESLPNSEGMKNQIIVQKGHAVNFGAPVTQMIRLAGGYPVEVGQSNKVTSGHIEEAINEDTAALLYIKSHHAVQKGMVSIEEMLFIAKKHNLPFIIDAAAEEDLKKYISLGADLVIYSGGKAIEGPTSGLITGRRDLISYCKLQYKGIGRAMKVGKENIFGLLKALELYAANDSISAVKKQKSQMEWLKDQVNQLKGLTAEIVQDEAGREIYRAEIKVDEKVLGMNAQELIEKLEGGNPAIYTRNHYANIGRINVDPRPLKDGDVEIIAERIKTTIHTI